MNISDTIRNFFTPKRPVPTVANAEVDQPDSPEQAELSKAVAALTRAESEARTLEEQTQTQRAVLAELRDMEFPTAESLVREETAKRQLARLESRSADVRTEVQRAQKSVADAQMLIKTARLSRVRDEVLAQAQEAREVLKALDAHWREWRKGHAARAQSEGVSTWASSASVGESLEQALKSIRTSDEIHIAAENNRKMLERWY